VVRLTLRAQSAYGQEVTDALKASESTFNRECSCPPGKSCFVEITEVRERRFEVVVKRPGAVIAGQGWTPLTAITGTYHLVFDQGASARPIQEVVSGMVGATIVTESENSTSSLLESLNIVVVDSVTLRQAQKRIAGCRRCSPTADIPFNSIIDVIMGCDSATRYILPEDLAVCPKCGRHLSEDSMVEYDSTFEETDC